MTCGSVSHWLMMRMPSSRCSTVFPFERGEQRLASVCWIRYAGLDVARWMPFTCSGTHAGSCFDPLRLHSLKFLDSLSNSTFWQQRDRHGWIYQSLNIYGGTLVFLFLPYWSPRHYRVLRFCCTVGSFQHNGRSFLFAICCILLHLNTRVHLLVRDVAGFDLFALIPWNKFKSVSCSCEKEPDTGMCESFVLLSLVQDRAWCDCYAEEPGCAVTLRVLYMFILSFILPHITSLYTRTREPYHGW